MGDERWQVGESVVRSHHGEREIHTVERVTRGGRAVLVGAPETYYDRFGRVVGGQPYLRPIIRRPKDDAEVEAVRAEERLRLLRRHTTYALLRSDDLNADQCVAILTALGKEVARG